MSLEKFIEAWRTEQELDVTPCPDDRPFVLDVSLTVLPIFKQLAGLAALLALGLVAVSWRSGRSSAAIEDINDESPMAAQNQRLPLTLGDALFVLYFLALGVGFMLVEIPLAQKLILPLGYPTLALTVILFSILLGGGAGAWASQRFADAALARWAIGCALGIAIATTFGIFLLGWLQSAMLLWSLPMRCVVTALLLLPLGFLLGAPFPAGMRLFARTRAPHIPLIWGLNGVASVVGSLCAAMGAKVFGFNAMLALGAAIYVGAAFLLMRAVRDQEEYAQQEYSPEGNEV
jgi:hypothetical protein